MAWGGQEDPGGLPHLLVISCTWSRAGLAGRIGNRAVLPIGL